MSPDFRAFAIDQLRRVVPAVRDRAMFGGVGIYSGDHFFGLIDNDTVYFKVDDTNRAAFEARGCGPFRPYGPDGETMQYYDVPGDVLEDAESLKAWAEAAVDVAKRKKSKRTKKPKTTG